MQQGAVIILIFLWVIAIIVIIALLRGYDDSERQNATSAHSYSTYSKQVPQTSLLCLSK